METQEKTARTANRLGREKSPYLLQHQYNPVDWYAWGPDAFERARAEKKPIFLSIGYSTCHWCHVMERESFEDEQVARFLNAHFVSIKLDREERPDIDKIYMTFVQAATGSGGWPLNVFLTPELTPFFGGTYFPPDGQQGRPGFLHILHEIHRVWLANRQDVDTSAQQVQTQLGQVTALVPADAGPLSRETLRKAGVALKQGYDAVNGGFGRAPKFPQPSHPRFLLRYAKRFQDEEARRMVLHTCARMAAGGIHDQLGGGFSRYSVDAQWLVPHFEKMLYDNAQLAELYLDAFLVSKEVRHAQVARGIFEYVLRDMTHPEGGFYSAEDADSEGHEGKFYCWTLDELKELLAPEELAAATRYFGLTAAGNFVDHSHPAPLPNQNVLSVADPSQPREGDLLRAIGKMYVARSRRVRPHLDDKILASWNGLMLAALARGYAVLGEHRYLSAAEKNARFLQEKLWDEKAQSLAHRWRDGEGDSVQLLDSYAFLLHGVLQLYEVGLEPGYLEFAIRLAERMLERFFDREQGGFWQSAASQRELILRLKEDYDGAEPSGNSVAVGSLLRLSKITGRTEFWNAAEKTLRLFASRLEELPHGVTYMLQALDFYLEEPRRAVITGDANRERTRALLTAVHSIYEPNKVVLGASGPVEEFARKLPAQEEGCLYLCTGNACQTPMTDPVRARELLARS